MAKYYCKYCGWSAAYVNALTSCRCHKNPNGKNHALYEGSEKSKYVCKYCGASASNINALTCLGCRKNPEGKYHVPAL